MKRLSSAVAVAGISALMLAGCGNAPSEGGNDKKAASGSTTKVCMVSDSGGFDDRSFNESGKNGLDNAKKNLGVETQTSESKVESDFVPNIDNLVDSNCNLIFTVGYLLAPATGTAGKAHKDVKFAIIDSTAQDEQKQPIELENVKPLTFDTAQASYLAGYLAAGSSKTGKVATYGGIKLPSVTVFMDGFADGVKKYNEVHGTNVQLLGWNKEAQEGSFVGSFEDQAKGKALTEGFMTQGADVIMPVAGPVGLGTLAAAKQKKDTMVVWVDSDGVLSNPDYEDIILTSVMKQIGEGVEQVSADTKDGKFTNKPYVGTLENGGVGLAPLHKFEDKVAQELKDEVKQLREDIIAGKVKVESPSSPKA